MTAIHVVPCLDQVTVTATGPITHRCPHQDEVDHGFATVTWTTDGATIEMHSLRGWLTEYTGQTLSHEELTADVDQTLALLDGIRDVHVTTRWITAGLTVEVASAVPRERQLVEGA